MRSTRQSGEHGGPGGQGGGCRRWQETTDRRVMMGKALPTVVTAGDRRDEAEMGRGSL